MRRFGATAVLLLFASTHAAAQSAKESFDQGMSALGAGRYEDAVQALDASYRKEPKSNVLYNLGLAYKGAGHPDRALEAFESYVRFADPKKDAKTIEALRAEIDRMKAAYARYTLKLTPPDAAIEIDATRASLGKGELWVQTGKHRITVHANGYDSYEQTLDVVAGRFDLEIHLREAFGPPEARAAALVDEGVTLQAAGNVPAAIDKWRSAEGILPTGRAEALLGSAEETSGDLPAAYQHLDQALKKPKDAYVKKNKRKLTSARDRIKGQLATLTIVGEPIGAEVFVNGKSVGVLPLDAPVPVLAGSVTVTAKKPSYSEFEELLDMPRRSQKTVQVSMHSAPPPVAAVPIVPLPAPKPSPDAVPALSDQPIAPLEAQAELKKPTQSDIEAGTEPQPEPPPESLTPAPSATGFEMALNFGYQRWIGGPKTDGSSGNLNTQIVLGARPLWPISVGVAINVGVDPGPKDTRFVMAVNPGIYVRGHLQQEKRELGLDGWVGVGFQPFAMQIAALKADPNVDPEVNPNSIDPNSAAATALKQNAGVDRVHTLQTINVPFELGGSFFVTEGFGFDLSVTLTLWLPRNSCLHDDKNRLCTDTGLKTQTSLFMGGGLTLLL